MIRGLLVAFNGRVTAGAGKSPISRSPCSPTKSRWSCCKASSRRWQDILKIRHPWLRPPDAKINIIGALP